MTEDIGPLSRYLDFIPDPEEFVSHLSFPLVSHLRINPIKAPEGRILELLQDEGVDLESTPVEWFYRVKSEKDLGHLQAYLLGLIYPQAISSALPVLALEPGTDDTVLDICAAPGGKATHMAQLMRDQGLIVANDRKFGRITALTANIKRLGITNTVVTFFRGEQFPLVQAFDKVLVDAPCSGEGKYRLGERGEIIFKKGGATNLPAIQKGILVRAFDLLRPGGVLVYSTCTFNPEENEGVITYLLKRRHARLVDWIPPLPASQGLTEFEGREYDSRCRLCRRFYPHQTGTVGFFVAKVVKPG